MSDSDVRNAVVEISLGSEGQVWVNTEHGCEFRAIKCQSIIIEDNRTSTHEPPTPDDTYCNLCGLQGEFWSKQPICVGRE